MKYIIVDNYVVREIYKAEHTSIMFIMLFKHLEMISKSIVVQYITEVCIVFY